MEQKNKTKQKRKQYSLPEYLSESFIDSLQATSNLQSFNVAKARNVCAYLEVEAKWY